MKRTLGLLPLNYRPFHKYTKSIEFNAFLLTNMCNFSSKIHANKTEYRNNKECERLKIRIFSSFSKSARLPNLFFSFQLFLYHRHRQCCSMDKLFTLNIVFLEIENNKWKKRMSVYVYIIYVRIFILELFFFFKLKYNSENDNGVSSFKTIIKNGGKTWNITPWVNDFILICSVLNEILIILIVVMVFMFKIFTHIRASPMISISTIYIFKIKMDETRHNIVYIKVANIARSSFSALCCSRYRVEEMALGTFLFRFILNF